MLKPDGIRLRHMCDAARLALKLSSGKKREDLETDPGLALSLIRCLEILGEAASKVEVETRAKLPGIPFEKAVSMRNRLIHAYFDVDLDIVWITITEDLPSVLPRLEAAAAEFGE
jgi:uncharacterized protein with HEPN domain